MSQTPYTIMLSGGLDLVTPAINVKPNFAIAAVNYEPEARGYLRIGGYERTDGQGKPSEATYSVLNFDAGTVEIAAGDVVTGATSGATGIALATAVVISGTYGGSDAAGYIALWTVAGTFSDNENLQVSAATRAVADGVATVNGATDDTTHETYRVAVIAAQRVLVTAVPGSGDIRGVWVYKGDKYAFRDNVGGTAGVMHKATTAGWVARSLGHVIHFTSGGTGTAFAEGETLTGGTSGATATIERVVRSSGSWGTDAAGFLVLSGITGTFTAAEPITSASGSADATDAQQANTLPAGGRYEFINHNFYGTANLERMYGVNGVGRGFEWDGTYFVPIHTGLSDALDKPTWISERAEHLFLAFAGGSMMYSSIGGPLVYMTSLGAGEIGFGNEITGILASSSSAMVVFGKGKIGYLTGNDKTDFILKTLNSEAGAKAWTAQSVGKPTYVDNQGIRDLTATQEFGNWKVGTKSRNVAPIFTKKAKNNVYPVASLAVKSKDQYRLYYADGTGVCMYVGRGKPEILPFQLPFTATCTCAGSNSDGSEILLAGDANGFVYELDKGTSFDGAEVEAFIRLPWISMGSPMREKRYHTAFLEIDGTSSTSIAIAVEYGYGDPNLPSGDEAAFTIRGGDGGFWNEANWDEFFWSSMVQGIAQADLDGLGRNISIAILSNATDEEPHALSALTINYSNRKQVR